MRKTGSYLIILSLLLVLATSCTGDFYEHEITEVSNLGTITSSVVGGVTTVSIHFDAAASSMTVDKENKKYLDTVDTGRYDTLVKVFNDFALEGNKRYKCSVSVNGEVNNVRKEGSKFYFGNSTETKGELVKNSYLGSMAHEFTMTISFGGETIVNYSNLPISPDGLAPGTLWNDNGTIRIV